MNRTQKYVFIFILATIAAIVFGKYSFRTTNPEEEQQAIQEFIYSVEQETKEVLKERARDFKEGKCCYLTDREETLPFQVYYSISVEDSLVYWSDNRIKEQSVTDRSKPVGFVGNGIFYKILYKEHDTLYSGYVLLSNRYAYENNYLKNGVVPFLRERGVSNLLLVNYRYDIVNQEGDFLFSPLFISHFIPSRVSSLLISMLYVLSLVSLLILLWYAIYGYYKRLKLWVYPLYFGIVFLFRWVLFYFELPAVCYNLELFSPQLFAASGMNRSLGDFLFNSILFIVPFYYFRKTFSETSLCQLNNRNITILTFGLLLLGYGLLFFSDWMFSVFVLNTTLAIDITHPLSMSIEGWLAIGALSFYPLAGCLLILYALNAAISHIGIRKVTLFSIAVFVPVFIVALLLFEHKSLVIILVILFVVLYFLAKHNAKKRVPIIVFKLVTYLCVALYATFFLFYYSELKEGQIRKLYAFEIIDGVHDPFLEFRSEELIERIQNDRFVQHFSTNYNQLQTTEYNAVVNHIEHYFFNSYWRDYEVSITICDSIDEIVDMANQGYNCLQFFDNLIVEKAVSHPTENLYLVSYTPSQFGYLSTFPLSNDTLSPYCYIELVKKVSDYAVGLPELLINKGFHISEQLKNYEYARYFNGELYSHTGSFPFPNHLEEFTAVNEQNGPFFYSKDYSFLLYINEDGRAVLIGKDRQSLISLISIFAYLLIFYGVILFLHTLINETGKDSTIQWQSISIRFQTYFSILLFVSFLVTGVITFYLVKRTNLQKNMSSMEEKTRSILQEFQMADIYLASAQENELNRFCEEVATQFFNDVNLFSPDGRLMATSRSAIFEDQLIAPLMNTKAYKSYQSGRESLFSQEEHIGALAYTSFYSPLYNQDGELMAIINIPYFTKTKEYERELTEFFTAYLNGFVLLFIIGLSFSIMISNYITSSITMLQKQFLGFKLGETQGKLSWERKDELGELVQGYNHLVDKLNESAALLTIKERQTAWSIMARQIAHEIRNVLTPIKLRVQHLLRAWDDKSADFDKLLSETGISLTEQIDALSSVAAEFSDFAHLPKAEPKEVTLIPIVERAISLYTEFGVQIHFISNVDDSTTVFADERLLIRVFNNLIKNAIQAIQYPEKGEIFITLHSHEESNVLVTVQDNGCGIASNVVEHVFETNFTTKTEGMGLGLAMVRTIVESTDGKIWFTSEEGKGSCFYFTLTK